MLFGAQISMYVAIRDATVSWLGYKEIVAGVKDLGLQSFELDVGRELKSEPILDISTESGRRTVVKMLEAENLRVCALYVSQDFTKENVEPEVKWVVDACKAASSLGVDAVRIDVPWSPKPGVAVEEYAKMMAKCIREVLGRTKDLDVSLGMENHGMLGNSRGFFQEILNDVKSERLGLTLDTGNLYWYGYPLDEVYEIIESFAPYVKHTHLKSFSFSEERRQTRRKPGEDYPKNGAPLYKGDIDLRRVIKTLKKAGYDKDLTIEDDYRYISNLPQEQGLDTVREEVKYMKSLI